ncbi:PepSY-associated TM helix domain-containing protein [Chitinophaga arvensicola]|uniref:Peptidase propeptide and YPEB domain-containing protein n=1 Tax=Chitinophaga arvensicola TaxID=29529 RepID=A0A1I0P665_9BACT|nr:PepSY-associated TM helix domain-containing protein [Chitinophaga arvensicola]SEW09568.1 Peptidase propeptide and YPEB domain-containing protein [Chitinophaga arvensicola]
MKVFFRRIHLYLGLTAGLVITISCLTGALLVFEKELTEAFHHDRYYVMPSGERLPLDKVAALVQQAVPGASISRIQLFADPARTIQVTVEEGKKGGKKGGKGEGKVGGEKDGSKRQRHEEQGNPGAAIVTTGEKTGKAGSQDDRSAADAQTAKPAPEKDAQPDRQDKMKSGGKEGAAPKKEKGRIAFVNPYTGQVIEVYSYQQSFYYQVFSLHRWLLAGPTGKMITGISTFIFLFILITGIILWWPKTRNIFKQRIKVKWDGNWKRVTNDLHVVLGFYTSIFLFIVAFTGLTWSFEWFSKAFYATLGVSPKPSVAPVSEQAAATDSSRITYEAALAIVKKAVPDAKFYSFTPPKDGEAAFMVSLLPAGNVNEATTTTYYLDQFNGKVLQSQTFAQRTAGQRIRASIKPLHTGAIFGTPSKIFSLILALLGATFPTTGTIMWLNRTRKKKKGAKAPAKAKESAGAKQVA